MTSDKWSRLHRSGKLARVLWPQLVEADLRGDVERRASSEGRQAPKPAKLLSDALRGPVSPLGNVAVGWPKEKGKR